MLSEGAKIVGAVIVGVGVFAILLFGLDCAIGYIQDEWGKRYMLSSPQISQPILVHWHCRNYRDEQGRVIIVTGPHTLIEQK